MDIASFFNWILVFYRHSTPPECGLASKDPIYKQNCAGQVTFLKTSGVENIRLVNIGIPILAEEMRDLKIQAERST